MHRFLSIFSQSSLVPLAKIANAPSRTIRIIWATITATMFMGLCICISLVVIQYCKHQTVFQLDYSGRHVVYDQIPGLTICPHAQEVHRLFRQAVGGETKEHFPWQDEVLMKEFHRKMRILAPTTPFDVLTHRLPAEYLNWSTALTAKSPVYRLLHNFTVRFRMQPPHLAKNYRLVVMEQVPNVRTFICTTFELRSRTPHDIWSHLEIEIDQTEGENKNFAPFTLIIHERGDLPFSAYDRHIHTVLHPNTEMSIYFSKSVTTRLNNARNPCHQGLDAKTLAADYQHAAGEASYEDFDWMKQNYSYPWYTDILDRTRLGKEYELTSELVKQLAKKTVRLFGTEFLYSREACGWAECCHKVRQFCNCSCSLQVLSHEVNRCTPGCEVQVCQNVQISYTTCPQPCVMIKFIKRNEITMQGEDVKLPLGYSRLKLVRSEAVHVATEEEIFSLAKLFSEVGGLCSLFIGFSCIFLFELLEAAFLFRKNENEIGSTNGSEQKSARSYAQIFRDKILNASTPFNFKKNLNKFNHEQACEEHDIQKFNCSHMNSLKNEIKRTSLKDESIDSASYPTWDGDILVIPVTRLRNGCLAMHMDNSDTEHSTGPLAISDEEFLSLLQQGRIKLQLMFSPKSR